MARKVIVLDFDGVIHPGYDGDPTSFDEPIEFAKWFVNELDKSYCVVVCSCRTSRAVCEPYSPQLVGTCMQRWLDDNGIKAHVWADGGKPIADVYGDDKGVCIRPHEGQTPEEKQAIFAGAIERIKELVN